MLNGLTRVIALLIISWTFSSPAHAQMRASERGQVHQTITGVEVEIDYSRPSVRGRMPVFGGVEPWDWVWTPGANRATSFKFSDDVKLNGADVKAGKYSVWFELVEEGPWRLMLHSDTTLFHLPAPSMDSAYVAVEINREEAPSFVETLRFDIENVRVDGADIQFRWANTLVPIRLDVDPGYEMVFSEEEAQPYTGEWLLDTSMARPADSLITRWKEDMADDQMEGLEKWLAAFEAEQEVRIEFEAETGHLVGYNPTLAEINDNDPAAPAFVLIRKGEGMFNEGSLENGELMFVMEWAMWEFDYDETGKADLLVQRQVRGDDIVGRAIRPDSE